MNVRTRLWLIILILALSLAACARGGSTQKMEAMEEEAAEAGTALETSLPDTGAGTKPAGESMEKDTEIMEEATARSEAHGGEMEEMEKASAEAPEAEVEAMEAPAWLDFSLTNARDVTSFTLSDHQGKVVLVETMAIWCSNCLRQQKEVLALHELLGEREDFLSVGLDIDPNEDAASLKGYTEQHGFDWVYAVSPPELSNALADLYGPNFLNPPSTPMLIIDRLGQVHPLPFGIKSAEELQAALQPFLAEGM